MVVYLLTIVVGLAVLVWGADRFVLGAAATAHYFGISPLVIGITIVGFGTSAPELLISFFSALQGNPALAVGNAIGSNIANIALILGCAAVVSPLTVHSKVLRRELPLSLIIMVFVVLLLMDLHLSRLNGGVLVGALVLVLTGLTLSALRSRAGDPIEAEYEEQLPTQVSLPAALGWLALGLALLLGSSRILVWAAVNVAQTLGVSDLIIGLTIVAVGTSLPELAASIMAVLKGEHDIAVGNVIGSNLFNILGVLGLAAIIHPTMLSAEVLYRDYALMCGLSVALFLMAYGWAGPGRINRLEGALLLICFSGYQTLLYFSARG